MSAVKDLASNTRRQSASYVQELASRVWERGIIDTVYHRGVVPYLNEKISNDVSQIDAVLGEFTLSTCSINALGQGQYVVKWKIRTRQKNQIEINSYFQMGVEKYLYGQGCRYDFEVTGFTTYQKKFDNHDKTTIFQANHSYYGRSRYDWCLIQFDGKDDPENLIFLQKILGFVEFHKGLPSPFLVEEMNYSPTHIRSNDLKDTNKYVGIHTMTLIDQEIRVIR